MPFDSSKYRTDAQSESSTRALAFRSLYKMHLNIVQKGEDNDGQDTKLITDDQARDLQCLLEGANANIPNFLELIGGCDKISDIPARDWKRVLHAAEVKAGVKKS